jgi:hypothetical protein
VLLRVDASGGAGAGVVAKADAPWSAIQSIDFSDVSGSALLEALSGYELTWSTSTAATRSSRTRRSRRSTPRSRDRWQLLFHPASAGGALGA